MVGENMRLGMYENYPVLIALKNQQYWGLKIQDYQSIDEILQNWNYFQETFLITQTDDKIFNNPQSIKLDYEKFQLPIKYSRQLPTINLHPLTSTRSLRPALPNIFNKFVSSLAGPNNEIKLPSDRVDWTSNLVIVIGAGGRDIKKEDFEDTVAGYMIGTDFFDQKLANADNQEAQVSISKSYKNFTPIGPFLSTIDSVGDLFGKKIITEINGEVVQENEINKMIFDVPTIIEYVSSIIELYPGDLLFTGIPSDSSDHGRYLNSGDVLTSSIKGLGTIQTSVK